MKKYYKKSTIKKRCIELGLTNVTIYYNKNDGYWLESDTFDNWISMDSIVAMIAIEKLFTKL